MNKNMKLRQWLGVGFLTDDERPAAKKWSGFFDIVMLFVLFWLPLQWVFETTGQFSAHVSEVADWVVWGIFVAESVIIFLFAKHKWLFIRSDWLNLILIILIFPPWWFEGSTYLAILRYLRIVVLLRIILPQFYRLNNIFSRHHFGSSLLAFLLVTILSGILVAYIDPGIGSFWRGIWWAVQTVTTVGYGDVVPNSALGQVFASILMVVGVLMYSLVSANLAAFFVERSTQAEAKDQRRHMISDVEQLEQHIAKLQASHEKIQESLDKLLAQKAQEEKKDE